MPTQVANEARKGKIQGDEYGKVITTTPHPPQKKKKKKKKGGGGEMGFSSFVKKLTYQVVLVAC